MKKETIIAMVAVGLITFIVTFLFVEKKVGSMVDELDVDYVKTSYMEGCVDGKYDMLDYCTCTYTKIEKKYGASGVVEMGVEYDATGKIPEKLYDVIAECIREL